MSSLGLPATAPATRKAISVSAGNEGRTWGKGLLVPQWKGVNEVALLRAANGDWVAACRTDIPARFKGETLDHYEGLGISISKDRGRTWSEVTKLYDWGRHHPSLVLMPNNDIVMTYVVRKGYVDTPDGYPQFGIEAVVSHDHGQTWDLDHRYILDTWAGNRKGRQRLVGQQPSDVLGPLAGRFHSHGLRHGLPIATRPGNLPTRGTWGLCSGDREIGRSMVIGHFVTPPSTRRCAMCSTRQALAGHSAGSPQRRASGQDPSPRIGQKHHRRVA